MIWRIWTVRSCLWLALRLKDLTALLLRLACFVHPCPVCHGEPMLPECPKCGMKYIGHLRFK